MSTTLIKLRIAGIAALLLFILSGMFRSTTNLGSFFSQAQQILIVVSFVIFGILILLQVYGFFAKSHVNEEEVE